MQAAVWGMGPYWNLPDADVLRLGEASGASTVQGLRAEGVLSQTESSIWSSFCSFLPSSR